MKKLISSLSLLLLLSASPAIAEEMHHHAHNGMSSSTGANIPMQRDGSGTSWLPDSSPVHALHFGAGDWSFMVHGSIFARYNWQNVFNSGKRSGRKFDAPNWFMAMAQAPVLINDRLTFRGMFTLDPLTIGGSGYPLLFQTGETWQGKSLIDVQHPHDLFAELSVTYSHAFNDHTNLFAYFGYPGEPALGPTAFMHRPSSFTNPDAPIGHHWQDATHITFGVGTLGLVYNDLKLDASVFTGREPDENRYNFDMPKFDSYSGRMTFNPSKDLSLQASFGYINSPESLYPKENVYKASASVVHNMLIDGSEESFTNLTTALIWGLNLGLVEHPGQALHSAILESELQLMKNNFLYGRFEFVQKDNHELILGLNTEKGYNIFALTLGASRNIFSYSGLSLSAGAQTTLYVPQKELEAFYGSFPVAFEVFLRLTPEFMNMQSHQHHHEMNNMEHQQDQEQNPGQTEHKHDHMMQKQDQTETIPQQMEHNHEQMKNIPPQTEPIPGQMEHNHDQMDKMPPQKEAKPQQVLPKPKMEHKHQQKDPKKDPKKDKKQEKKDDMDDMNMDDMEDMHHHN